MAKKTFGIISSSLVQIMHCNLKVVTNQANRRYNNKSKCKAKKYVFSCWGNCWYLTGLLFHGYWHVELHQEKCYSKRKAKCVVSLKGFIRAELIVTEQTKARQSRPEIDIIERELSLPRHLINNDTCLECP